MRDIGRAVNFDDRADFIINDFCALTIGRCRVMSVQPPSGAAMALSKIQEQLQLIIGNRDRLVAQAKTLFRFYPLGLAVK